MKRILLIAISFLFLQGVSAQEISVEDFFKRPNFDSARISPTGKFLAATVLIEGRKTLAVFDRESKKLLQIYNFGQKENQEVGSFGWLNDERVYATMVVKLGPLDQPAGTGYMFAANVDGSKPMQIMPRATRAGGTFETPYGFRILDTLRDDPENIIVAVYDSSFPVAYKVNVYSGSRQQLGRSPVKYGSMLVDRDGELRIAVGSDLSKVKFYGREKGQDEWQLIYEYEESEGGMRPVYITSDNRVVLVSSDTADNNGLYEFSIASKEITKILDLEGDAEITGYIFDNNMADRSLLGVTREPGYVVKEWIKPDSPIAKIHNILDNAFKGQVSRILNFTNDGNTALVLVYSDKNPGTLYTLDIAKFQLKELMTPRDWIEPKQMAAMKPITFTARDGLEIHGYLTLPNGKDKNLPLVVMVHGGPYGPKDDWGFNPEVQFLANRGYAVLQINYRGSGGRGSDFQYSAYRQMGREMQDDLTDGTLWAVEQGYADKDRMCIYGASYGGYAAAYGVVKEPDLYKCAIAYVGVYDIAIQAKLSDTAGSKEGRKFLEDAWNAYDEEFVKERSALYHLDKLKAALFIVHGDDDPRVPVENAHALTDALDKMNYPYELMIKDREGHGFYDFDNTVELYTRMEKFLKQHIGN